MRKLAAFMGGPFGSPSAGWFKSNPTCPVPIVGTQYSGCPPRSLSPRAGLSVLIPHAHGPITGLERVKRPSAELNLTSSCRRHLSTVPQVCTSRFQLFRRRSRQNLISTLHGTTLVCRIKRPAKARRKRCMHTPSGIKIFTSKIIHLHGLYRQPQPHGNHSHTHYTYVHLSTIGFNHKNNTQFPYIKIS